MGKLGRPSADYSITEFGTILKARRELAGLSLKNVGAALGINHGSISAAENGHRSLKRKDREALMCHLGFSEDNWKHFLGSGHKSERSRPIPVPVHFPLGARTHLDLGQVHLFRAEYDQAVSYFKGVFYSPQWSAAADIRADAATRLAWVYFEKGECSDSEKWIADAIRLVQHHFKESLTQIFASLERGSSSAIASPTDYAILILWSALHVRSKLLTERIVYRTEDALRDKARSTFDQIQAIDDYLLTPLSIGHNQRWFAVFLAATTNRKKEANLCLSKSKEMFEGRGLELERAYLTRDEGVAYWQANRPSEARKHLESGASALGACDDVRGMGAAFCALCRVITEDGGTTETARRYALAGAVLHPYFFVLQKAKFEYQCVLPFGRQKDMEDLFNGAHSFQEVRAVLTRIYESDAKATAAIRHNLRQIMPPGTHIP